jgi:hypothetical protein
MNTPITITTASAINGHGGVFYFERINKVDFKQLTSGDKGIY